MDAESASLGREFVGKLVGGGGESECKKRGGKRAMIWADARADGGTRMEFGQCAAPPCATRAARQKLDSLGFGKPSLPERNETVLS